MQAGGHRFDPVHLHQELISKWWHFDIGFLAEGCWIFNKLEEVKCSIQGTGSYMGCDCILRYCLRTSGGTGNKRELLD